MMIISDRKLMDSYISKYSLEDIFDREVLNTVLLHFYGKGEFILEAETELKYYYLLVDGKIKVSYLFENGKSMFLKFYQAFNTIGDMELVKNSGVLCNVEAIRDSCLIAVPAALLRSKYLDNVKFLHHLTQSLSEKLSATINNSSYNYIYPLTNRLASFLAEHIAEGDFIALNSSFEEIAQFLGTTYRHLNRTFKELEEEGIIRTENRKIFILDEKRLRELSKNLYMKSL